MSYPQFGDILIASSTIEPASFERRGDALIVSGASFAGLATAYWLNRLGYRVTLVEVAKGLRRGGTPVDIEGETIDILNRMKLADAVRAKALPPRRLAFKDADDKTLGTVGDGNDQASHERYEIHRDDLLDILFGALADEVELLFGRSIDWLEEGADAVSVTFNDGERRDFALCLAAMAIGRTRANCSSARASSSPTSWAATSS